MDLFYYRVIIFVIACLRINFVECALTQYNFHENCGRTLDPFKVAGEVIFSSKDIHDARYRTRHCEVTISPKEVGTSNKNRILFYFTEFDIGRRCSNNNVTVIDGRHHYVHVQGIPDVLCGHNTSLEDNSTIFTSLQSDIRLIYEWSEYGELFSGSFRLIFIAFYEGPCDSENGVFGCDNDRCISEDISCQDGINSCGNGKDPNCKALEEAMDFLSSVIETIKDFGILLAVVIGIFLAKVFIYDNCAKKYGSFKNFPIIKLAFTPRDTNRSASMSYRQSSVTEPEVGAGYDQTSLSSVESDRISVADDGRGDGNETTPANNTDLPTYDTFISDTQRFPPTAPEGSFASSEPTAPPMSSDVAPPPSYEDVMANNDKYVQR